MQKGLIISNISNIYNIENNQDKKIYKCTARGKLKNKDINPVVGDKVEFETINIEKSEGIIENILQRKNYIKRPKIANLSQIVFVISMKMPKPDLLLLDKQLAFAEFIGVNPIIVLNKVDLVNKSEIEEIEKLYEQIGYTIIKTEANTGIGVDVLKKLLKNNITVFSGNSGVGKSTLINKIFKKNITEEGYISAKNKKGKNTTTSVNLYKIDDYTYVADTPGFSTFDIFEINSDSLDQYFIEFYDFLQFCQYKGCNHIKEINCGIKDAISQNKVSQNRYNRYCRIYDELKEKELHKW